jgi:Leucine Rich repeats (2 copies)
MGLPLAFRCHLLPFSFALLASVGCSATGSRDADSVAADSLSTASAVECFVPICQANERADRALIQALKDEARTSDCQLVAERITTTAELPYALRRRHLTSIRALGCFTHFTELNFYYNDVTDLTPLAGMRNLRKLSLASNRGVTTIAPLAKLKLARLYVRYTNVGDLDALTESRSTLRFLDVTAAPVAKEQIAFFTNLVTVVGQGNDGAQSPPAGGEQTDDAWE